MSKCRQKCLKDRFAYQMDKDVHLHTSGPDDGGLLRLCILVQGTTRGVGN